MKTYLKSLPVVVCLLMNTLTAAIAQNNDSEKIQIPLSQPNKPGTLRANLLNGSIMVTGHKGKDVVVTYSARDGKSKNKPRDNDESQGMRRIQTSTTGLEVREENNTVTVKTDAFNRAVDLQIQVPYDFSVKLKTLNDGVLLVEDVNGELDVDNLNGNITLRNVAGSASASTLNGDIIASFKKVTPNMPMAFSSLNGKIDVTLPPSAKFNAKLKSDNGEVFTDFDMALEKGGKTEGVVPPNNFRGNDARPGTRIYLDKWLTGKINGGGPEILFKNFNGNIYIRKSK
ncbi:DUF4097 family beta strand repeat-containing protein [Adhaeribacter rhizoryzae]|uniref:DUF4097 domain-containing protein n=1 Tax=Adhaeribacter rhizoryzae TaxID=2607907 RepID=A0A5M6DL63_9BACT|nr:DUF4097 family beta strand repeat-containing protein [Adhaeribacter rhizoryzae]KAA5548271.1 DUF4097 domain-containing protein [Adhaeribacter rhizoryzae]